jgi:hypothetical protein
LRPWKYYDNTGTAQARDSRALDVAGDVKVYVIGSQAIFGQFPNPPAELTASVEADIQPKNKIENTDLVGGPLVSFPYSRKLMGFTFKASSLRKLLTCRKGGKIKAHRTRIVILLELSLMKIWLIDRC